MVSRLRDLKISEVSSVDRGAAVGARIILRKRHVLDDACRALDAVVASALQDGTLAAKGDFIAASVAEFQGYLKNHGVGAGEAERAALEVIGKYYSGREEEEVSTMPDALVEKTQRSQRVQTNLQEAIDDYARTHNVSKSIAADRIILGGGVMSDMHRMERQIDDAQDGIRKDSSQRSRSDVLAKFNALVADVLKSQGHRLTEAQATEVVKRTAEGAELMQQYYGGGVSKAAAVAPHGGGGGSYSRSDARSLDGNPSLTGDVISVEDAASILRRLAADAVQNDPSLTYSQAVNLLARTQQWSPEMGRQAAARAMEQGRQSGGGYADGYRGPAMDLLTTKAEQLRRENPTLSKEQAFAKAFTDPKNRHLMRQEYQERMAGMQRPAPASM